MLAGIAVSSVFAARCSGTPQPSAARPVAGPAASASVIAPAPAATASPEPGEVFQAISGEVSNIFAKCKDAVVRIQAVDSMGTHAGTGFFIDPTGTIYTHYSVAGRAWNLTVEFADKKYPATCLLADPRSGVTLLSIQAGGPTPFLPLGNSADLKITSPVVSIGYPMDLPESPTFGLIAGFDQKFFDHYLPTTHIRANMPVQSGEQGAPLLNAKGEVVGILVCQYDYGAVCLGLPIQAAEKVRADYLRYGTTRPGWIGVTAKPADGDEEHGAVRVDALADDSPAAHSGLQNGDVLLQVGHTAIHKFGDLRDASFYLTADESVPITVERDGQEVTLKVHAADPPGGPPVATAPRGIEGNGIKLALPNVPRSADEGLGRRQ